MHKVWYFALICLFLPFNIMGQKKQAETPRSAVEQSADSIILFRFLPGQPTFYSPHGENDIAIEKAACLIDQHRDVIVRGDVSAVTEAVHRLLKERDGLMLGICNGFQALIKLGLVPYGDIVEATPDAPTLTFNTIGRHQSRLVRTRVASNLSPWLSKCAVGEVHNIAISHGEGRFVAAPDLVDQLVTAGQVATQYVGEDGVPSMALDVNPNGSVLAIEGITSPDGRVLGKMGHTERSGAGLSGQRVPAPHRGRRGVLYGIGAPARVAAPTFTQELRFAEDSCLESRGGLLLTRYSHGTNAA